MNKPISSGLKTVFLIHAVVGVLFGLGYLLIPATVAGWFNMPLDGPTLRLVGGAVLGFTVTSILGYLARQWGEVRIVVAGEALWTLLAALISLWFVLNGTWPAAGWLNFALMAFFFLAFGYFYWREETMAAPTPAPRT